MDCARLIGGVVDGGATIVEIVPQSQPLEVEVGVQPADINSVSIFHPARITITALNARLEDPLDGSVSYVCADSLVEENTGGRIFCRD